MKLTVKKALPWVVLAAGLFVVNITSDAFGQIGGQNGLQSEALLIQTDGTANFSEGTQGTADSTVEESQTLWLPEKAVLTCTIDGQNVMIQGEVTENPMAQTASTAAVTEAAVEGTTVMNAAAQETSMTEAAANGTPESSAEQIVYDDYYYLFELQPYESTIGVRTDYCGRVGRGEAVSFTVPLGFGTDSDKLYSSFALAISDGTSYYAISPPTYISNPEVLAKHTQEYKEPLSKKGLLLDGDMISDAMTLGVKNSSIDIAFQQIIGEGIEYEYDGKTYHFNKELMEYYDKAVLTMSSKDISVTAVILNGWNDAMPQLILPGVERKAGVNYYNFNASTKEGVDTIKAIASFLAERYSGTEGSKGKISNWIIGNEINNQIWNYAGPMEMEDYVEEYIRAFRVFYTAIRSVSKNDRVFFSTDFFWNNPERTDTYYSAKEVIDTFARLSREGGDMDWGLAYHPYPDPLTEPEFWDDGETGRAVDSVDTTIVNFKNLHVLTDYFQRAELLDRSGQVRHIILSEQGFTSRSATRGDVEQIQAAALAYAYFIADSNPYIDAILMHRQVDNVGEAKSYVAVGLWECDMNSPDVIRATTRKKAWEVFKYMDTKQAVERTEFAKEIIGIEKWSDVIPDFKWKRYE